MPRNRGSRTLRYVSSSIGTEQIKYIFYSALKESLKDNFGQTDVTKTFNVSGAIMASNNFKPARGQKFQSSALGYEGSFCSDDKIKTLKADDVVIKRKIFSKPALKGKAQSVLYYGTINGLKFGYRVNDTELPADFATATGLTLATGNDLIIMGASFPRLGEAKYTNPTTGKTSTYLCDPSVYDNLSGDWSGGRAPLSTQDDLINLLGL